MNFDLLVNNGMLKLLTSLAYFSLPSDLSTLHAEFVTLMKLDEESYKLFFSKQPQGKSSHLKNACRLYAPPNQGMLQVYTYRT